MLLKFNDCVFINRKINLLNMNRKQLKMFFLSLGEKSFRADQVMTWIYHRYCNNFDDMTDLKISLRDKLKQCAEIRAPKIVNKYCSCDGTIKWCFQVGTQKIETVYIPKSSRATLCISSQIGCILQCTFCSTGQQGFSRNLCVSEIIGQVWSIFKIFDISGSIKYPPITNIVVMGMGEPLLNFDNLVISIDIMLDDFGFGLSKKRVTISTSGIVPGINKLANTIDVSLAVSLHAPNDSIRDQIMPINKKWDIFSLIHSVQYYLSKSRISPSYVTIEYIMLDHINDDISCAYQLIQCLKDISCKVNLIPWNPIPNSSYRCSTRDRIIQFSEILLRSGLVTTIRKVRGNDINAACGQLVGVVLNKKNNMFLHNN